MSGRRARLALAAAVLIVCVAGVGVVMAAVPRVKTSFPTAQGRPFGAPRAITSKNGVLRTRFVADESMVRVGRPAGARRAYNKAFPGRRCG